MARYRKRNSKKSNLKKQNKGSRKGGKKKVVGGATLFDEDLLIHDNYTYQEIINHIENCDNKFRFNMYSWYGSKENAIKEFIDCFEAKIKDYISNKINNLTWDSGLSQREKVSLNKELQTKITSKSFINILNGIIQEKSANAISGEEIQNQTYDSKILSNITKYLTKNITHDYNVLKKNVYLIFKFVEYFTKIYDNDNVIYNNYFSEGKREKLIYQVIETFINDINKFIKNEQNKIIDKYNFDKTDGKNLSSEEKRINHEAIDKAYDKLQSEIDCPKEFYNEVHAILSVLKNDKLYENLQKQKADFCENFKLFFNEIIMSNLYHIEHSKTELDKIDSCDEKKLLNKISNIKVLGIDQKEEDELVILQSLITNYKSKITEIKQKWSSISNETTNIKTKIAQFYSDIITKTTGISFNINSIDLDTWKSEYIKNLNDKYRNKCGQQEWYNPDNFTTNIEKILKDIISKISALKNKIDNQTTTDETQLISIDVLNNLNTKLNELTSQIDSELKTRSKAKKSTIGRDTIAEEELERLLPSSTPQLTNDNIKTQLEQLFIEFKRQIDDNEITDKASLKEKFTTVFIPEFIKLISEYDKIPTNTEKIYTETDINKGYIISEKINISFIIYSYEIIAAIKENNFGYANYSEIIDDLFGDYKNFARNDNYYIVDFGEYEKYATQININNKDELYRILKTCETNTENATFFEEVDTTNKDYKLGIFLLFYFLISANQRCKEKKDDEEEEIRKKTEEERRREIEEQEKEKRQTEEAKKLIIKRPDISIPLDIEQAFYDYLKLLQESENFDDFKAKLPDVILKDYNVEDATKIQSLLLKKFYTQTPDFETTINNITADSSLKQDYIKNAKSVISKYKEDIRYTGSKITIDGFGNIIKKIFATSSKSEDISNTYIPLFVFIKENESINKLSEIKKEIEEIEIDSKSDVHLIQQQKEKIKQKLDQIKSNIDELIKTEPTDDQMLNQVIDMYNELETSEFMKKPLMTSTLEKRDKSVPSLVKKPEELMEQRPIVGRLKKITRKPLNKIEQQIKDANFEKFLKLLEESTNVNDFKVKLPKYIDELLSIYSNTVKQKVIDRITALLLDTNQILGLNNGRITGIIQSKPYNKDEIRDSIYKHILSEINKILIQELDHEKKLPDEIDRSLLKPHTCIEVKDTLKEIKSEIDRHSYQYLIQETDNEINISQYITFDQIRTKLKTKIADTLNTYSSDKHEYISIIPIIDGTNLKFKFTFNDNTDTSIKELNEPDSVLLYLFYAYYSYKDLIVGIKAIIDVQNELEKQIYHIIAQQVEIKKEIQTDLIPILIDAKTQAVKLVLMKQMYFDLVDYEEYLRNYIANKNIAKSENGIKEQIDEYKKLYSDILKTITTPSLKGEEVNDTNIDDSIKNEIVIKQAIKVIDEIIITEKALT